MDKIETFYIAGLNSKNEESKTFKKLKEYIPNIKIIKYNISDFKNEQEIVNYLKSEIIKNSDVTSIFDRCIIGNSFGAKLAYQLQTVAYHLLLINIPIYFHINVNNLFGNSFKLNNKIVNDKSVITHILSLNDELVDTKLFKKALINREYRGDYIEINDSHFLDKNESYNLIYNSYNKLINITI